MPGAPPSNDQRQRFIYNFSATQSIATSHAQNDSGLFEVNFRDERYLPFEYAGAVSRWMITMPPACNAFDFDTITDVILKLSYTARDGGDLLRTEALQAAICISVVCVRGLQGARLTREPTIILLGSVSV